MRVRVDAHDVARHASALAGGGGGALAALAGADARSRGVSFEASLRDAACTGAAASRERLEHAIGDATAAGEMAQRSCGASLAVREADQETKSRAVRASVSLGAGRVASKGGGRRPKRWETERHARCLGAARRGGAAGPALARHAGGAAS